MEAQIERPKFRTDLVAQPLEENGRLVVEVIDPDSGDSFRFYEVEYYVASAMNGERSVSGLRDWALSELGVSPDENELGQLVRTLADLGYLADVDASTAESAATSAATPIAPPVAAVSNEVELGFAGASASPSAGASASPSAGEEAVPLGFAGAGDEVPAETADTSLDEASFDLGLAGKSDVAVARVAAPAAPAVELGLPGKTPSAPAAVVTPPAPVIARPADPASEMSFEGLMDDGPSAPAAVTGRLGGKRPLPSDFSNLDGITPPPADVPIPSLRPITDVDLDDDGPTNLPPAIPIGGTDDDDVSVDLSAHLDLGVDDLKEAVRQSKVMNAVEIPADLLAELEGEAPAAAPMEPANVALASEAQPPAAAATPAAAKPAAEKKPGQKAKVLSKSDLKAKAKANAPTFPLPEPPTSVKPVEPPQDGAEFTQGSGLMWLVAVLLLVVVAAGGYYYYTQILNKNEDKSAKPAPGDRPATRVKPGVNKPGIKKRGGPGAEIPVPIQPSVATFVRVEGSTESITMPKSAVLASVAEDGKVVAYDDVVARLAGAKRIQKKIASVTNRRDKHYGKKLADAKKRLEAATAAGSAGQVRAWTKKVKAYDKKIVTKTATIAELNKKLEALALKAPVSGKVKRIARPRAWVAKDKPVLEIVGTSKASATFTGKLPKAYAVGDKVVVHAEKDAAKKATCTRREGGGGAIVLDCPWDASFKAGDRVVAE